jgi:DNA polymerase alpha subunit A
MVEVDGKYHDKLEVKGLDMKRREYCSLSKDASSKLLNEILSGDDTEVVIGRIHEYLRTLAGDVRENKIPAQKYIIYTKLGKHPKEYPNSDSMPQIQVALREISRGKTVRKDDVISYIITGDGKDTTPAAKRAYTPQDVLKSDSGLVPDSEWYLVKQIFPPVERLCANISGTDSVHLAECLGLDTTKYALSNSSSRNNNAEIQPLESQIPDEVRFRASERLSLRCRACKESFVFEGLANTPDVCTVTGLVCPQASCGKPLPLLTVVAQLEHQIRVQTARYYEGWLVCDDCGMRTRQMSVYGQRCIGPNGLARGCLGKMRYEFSEKDMYNQLLFWAGVWDVEKAKRDAKGDQKGELVH